MCSQNLTLARITTRVQWQKYGEALRIPILESQSRLNPTAILNHNPKSDYFLKTYLALESEVMQPLVPIRLRTECPAT